MVDFELWDGTQGQACVTARDDNIGLALLTPLLEPRTYDFAKPSDEAPTLGDQLLLIQHAKLTPILDQRVSLVVGYMPSNTGYDFFRIWSDTTTGDGAVIVSRFNKIQGIRMPSSWLWQNELGDPGEVWAIDAPKMASIALPALRSGRVAIAMTREGQPSCSVHE